MGDFRLWQNAQLAWTNTYFCLLLQSGISQCRHPSSGRIPSALQRPESGLSEMPPIPPSKVVSPTRSTSARLDSAYDSWTSQLNSISPMYSLLCRESGHGHEAGPATPTKSSPKPHPPRSLCSLRSKKQSIERRPLINIEAFGLEEELERIERSLCESANWLHSSSESDYGDDDDDDGKTTHRDVRREDTATAPKSTSKVSDKSAHPHGQVAASSEPPWALSLPAERSVSPKRSERKASAARPKSLPTSSQMERAPARGQARNALAKPSMRRAPASEPVKASSRLEEVKRAESPSPAIYSAYRGMMLARTMSSQSWSQSRSGSRSGSSPSSRSGSTRSGSVPPPVPFGETEYAFRRYAFRRYASRRNMFVDAPEVEVMSDSPGGYPSGPGTPTDSTWGGDSPSSSLESVHTGGRCRRAPMIRTWSAPRAQGSNSEHGDGEGDRHGNSKAKSEGGHDHASSIR